MGIEISIWMGIEIRIRIETEMVIERGIRIGIEIMI